MARIVCQVLHRPHRITFVWSEGAAFFEPYHLEQEVEVLCQAAELARRQLASLMDAPDPHAAQELARAGHEMFKAIFRHEANDPNAREIQNWLQVLRDRNELTSLDILDDEPGRIPWNVVYDQQAHDDALRAGDPQALRRFWGRQINMASGKRVNPLRTASVLESPNVLLVADSVLLSNIPATQRNLLSDWAAAQSAESLDSLGALRDTLRDEAPDVLYMFVTHEHGALRIGGESVTPAELREMLAGAAAGNPDPVIFLQACSAAPNWQAWQKLVTEATAALTGVIMPDTPVTPAVANVLGVEALSAFMRGEELGRAVLAARGDDLARLAYTAFCPTHVHVAVEGIVKPALPAPEPLPLPDYPYRPLAPFESEDRALFTGREDDTVRCAGVLDEAAVRALVLHGGSGVGKSSFLRAGLIPHLETEAVGFLALRDRTPDEEFNAESTYPVVALRPGHDLLGQLAEALSAFCAQAYSYTTPSGARVSVDLPGVFRSWLSGAPDTAITAAPLANAADAEANRGRGDGADDSAAALWRVLQREPSSFAGLLDELTRRLPFDLLFVIEQAEDLFAQESKGSWRRQQRALQAVGDVLASPARCKFIFATRSDCFGRLTNAFPFGSESWRSYYLGELNNEQMLRAAVWPTIGEPAPYASEIPAEKYQLTFAEGVAQRMVRDVARAAEENRHSALALLQIYCANLYDRAVKRGARTISAGDLKDAGPAGEALVRVVDKKLKDMAIAPADRIALRGLMKRLYVHGPDGAATRALLPYREAERLWKGSTPLDVVVDAAAGEGLLEASQMLVEGRPDTFLSLPQEALGQVTLHWDEERKRKAVGRASMVDMMWFVVPLLFLVAVITWKITRDSTAKQTGDETATAKDEQFAKALQAQADRDRWPIYVGDLTRAQQAWNSGNALLTRQLLLKQQPLQQPDLRDFEWYCFWKKVQGAGMESGHKGLITRVAMTADGALGASASVDGSVKIWNLAKGLENAVLTGHAGPVFAVAFSPDGKMIASAGADKIVRLWDARAGGDKFAVVNKEQKALIGHDAEVRALVFGTKTLASGGADKQVILWNLETGKPAQVFKEHTQPVQAIAITGDGKTIASAGGEVLIHDGQKVSQTIKPPGAVVALAFTEDGKTLATGGTESDGMQERGVIRFWDTASGKETGTALYHAGGVFSLAYLPGSKELASGGKDNLLRVWDVTAGREVRALQGHIGWVNSLAVPGSGDKLLTGSYDGSIKTWTNLPPETLAAHKGAATALVFVPDDRAVVSGGQDGAVRMWDPATGKLLTELTGLGPISALSYTSKLRRLAMGAWDKGSVRQWEVTWDAKEGVKAKEVPALTGHGKGTTCVAYSPDGKYLASGSADGTAIVWDVEAGKQKALLKGHSGEVRCLAFPPEGPILMTGDAAGLVRQWDIERGSEISPPLPAHGGPVTAASYLAIGNSIGFVTAGADRAVRFWVTVENGFGAWQEHRTHGQPITALAASANRRFIATGSLDQTIKLYDTQFSAATATTRRYFGLERFTFADMKTPIRALAVSPNNLIMAAAGDDGSIRFWRAAQPEAPKEKR